jgi:hypothetical protein
MQPQMWQHSWSFYPLLRIPRPFSTHYSCYNTFARSTLSGVKIILEGFASMPYCSHCGTENTADSKFCRNCGRPPFGNVSPSPKPKLPFWKKLFGNIPEESKQKLAFWNKIPERGRHPAIGTLGMVLSLIGLVLFCSKPPLGMTILSLGVMVLVYAAITGNLKLFR